MKYDVVLVGSGIASSTLGVFLHLLNPALRILILEKDKNLTTQSTMAWNNSGTGHAAYCELNYTPMDKDKNVNIEKAKQINESFELSLQFWAYLVKQNIISAKGINRIPHVSFVWGEENIEFLEKRYQAISKSPQFKDMQYSNDIKEIANWIPLVTSGREDKQKYAATKVDDGFDIDFGKITTDILTYLSKVDNIDILTSNKVVDLEKFDNKWQLKVEDIAENKTYQVETGFVFIGAGGASLDLLQKSKIKNFNLYGGFPVSGQFLLCKNPEIVKQHYAKVYGLADVNTPPMSVPHLDTRIIDGKQALLFGPFAGITTKFLKNGSVFDLFKSLNCSNLIPMVKVGVQNISLLSYLIKQGLHNHKSRMNYLRQYYPQAKDDDWELIQAGKRVQVIKNDIDGAKLQFGTEVVLSEDNSLATLLGASPGASIIANIAIDILGKSFAKDVENNIAMLQEIIPSYGRDLKTDKELLAEVRAYVKEVLG